MGQLQFVDVEDNLANAWGDLVKNRCVTTTTEQHA